MPARARRGAAPGRSVLRQSAQPLTDRRDLLSAV